MRHTRIALLLAGGTALALLIAAVGAADALAQPAPGAAPNVGPVGSFGNSRQVALFFWFVAGLTVAGSIFVITRRNLISAVMGMVGTFFALAALYAMLYAHFMAAIQVLVYAGAIMVLFVFVVMILNHEEEEPWAVEGLLGKALAGAALLYLLVRVGQVLWKVKDSGPVPAPQDLAALGAGTVPYEWGSTAAIGKILFTRYLFPFEAVSVVLLVAVVGAIAVARPHQQRRSLATDLGMEDNDSSPRPRQRGERDGERGEP